MQYIIDQQPSPASPFQCTCSSAALHHGYSAAAAVILASAAVTAAAAAAASRSMLEVTAQVTALAPQLETGSSLR
jgi:hypothetical protein